MDRDRYLGPAAKMPDRQPANHGPVELTEAAQTVIAQTFLLGATIYLVLVVTLARKRNDPCAREYLVKTDCRTANDDE